MDFTFTHSPLERMRLTQGFGGDATGGALPLPGGRTGGYRDMGLRGHNGWDLSTGPSGKKVFAVSSGWVEASRDEGYGVNARLIVDVDESTQLECVYGHLKEVVKTGKVQGGEQIAISNNTGISTGPHLHFGVRVRKKGQNGSAQVQDYGNGYFGYVDPSPFFHPDTFALPVDLQYGNTWATPGVPTEWEWMKTNAWFWATFKRLMTKQERNAFRFGFWDVRTVLDPAMFDTWSQMTKPEAVKRGLVK